jgi:hypothetical protein
MPAMLLPIDFVHARAELTWREMVVGLDRGFVQQSAGVGAAHSLLADGRRDDRCVANA